MAHVREQIRNQIATILASLAGGRVYTSRVYPLEVLPAIGIYAGSESSQQDPTIGIPVYNREVDVVIEIATEALSDVDAAVDELAADVEALMAADLTLSGLAADAPLISTSVSLDGGDSEIPIAFARLTYRVWYRTTAANPEAAI